MLLLLATALGSSHHQGPVVEVGRRSVVLAGGVSRGSYQAGQMWVMNRHLEALEAKEDVEVTVVGSSAGGIVALVSAIELLHGPTADPAMEEKPEFSLLFQSWVPMGLSTFIDSVDYHPAGYDPRCQWVYRPGEPCPVGDMTWMASGFLSTPLDFGNSTTLAREGLISHAHFDLVIEGLRQVYEGTLRRDLADGELPETEDWLNHGVLDSVRVGLTAARLVADQDEGGNTREVNEAFAFELHSDRRWPDVLQLRCNEEGHTAAADWRKTCTAQGLQLEVSAPIPFADVGWHVKPTSGIPLAFPTWEMPCEVFAQTSLFPVRRDRPDSSQWRCWEVDDGMGSKQLPVVLIDGGTFDGNPMRLAEQLAKAVQGGQDSGAPPKTQDCRGCKDFIYMDPDTEVDAPTRPLPPLSRTPPKVRRLITGVPTTARLQSITQYRHEQGPTFENRMIMVPVDTVPVAHFMGDFFGLFDRSFRVYDFYAGMLDANKALVEDGFEPIETIDSPLYAAVSAAMTYKWDELHREEARLPDWAASCSFTPWSEMVDCVFDAARDLDPDAWVLALEDAGNQRMVEKDAYPRTFANPKRLGQFKDSSYPGDLLEENLRTITYLMGVRATDLKTQPHVNREEGWFANELSHPSEPRYRFTPVDLGGPGGRERFDILVQERLSWWAGEAVSRNLATDKGATLIVPMNIARSAVFGHRSQFSFYSATPVQEGSMFTFGVGLDAYKPVLWHHVSLGGGVRLWLGAPPDPIKHLNGSCNEEPGDCLGVSHGAELRLPVSFPGGHKLLGPLHGVVGLEIAPLARLNWSGLGWAASPLMTRPIGSEYADPIGANGYLSLGLEFRLRLAEAVSVSLFAYNFLQAGEDVHLHASLSLTAPGRSLARAPKANWPRRPPPAVEAFHWRGDLAQAAAFSLRAHSWVNLGGQPWFGLGPSLRLDPALDRVLKDRAWSQAVVAPGLYTHYSFATREVVIAGTHRGSRGFYGAVGGGPTWIWARKEGQESIEGALGLHAELVLLGHEWAWQPCEDSATIDLGIGLGARGALYDEGTMDALDALNMTYPKWGFRPELSLSAGITPQRGGDERDLKTRCGF